MMFYFYLTCHKFNSLDSVTPWFAVDEKSSTTLTILSGFLDEGIHSALSIAPFGGHCGDVVPVHGPHNVYHGLGLVGVRGYHSGEEVVAGVVA